MKGLSNDEKILESNFGLISGGMLWGLCEASKKAGSKWEYNKPETMEIIVNKENADEIYSWCRAIRSGLSIGLNADGMSMVKAARTMAHRYLVEEANDPNTTIERKIELVKLTSKNAQ
jgi:hypothetical protein